MNKRRRRKDRKKIVFSHTKRSRTWQQAAPCRLSGICSREANEIWGTSRVHALRSNTKGSCSFIYLFLGLFCFIL